LIIGIVKFGKKKLKKNKNKNLCENNKKIKNKIMPKPFMYYYTIPN
jgi:hypothetical protein